MACPPLPDDFKFHFAASIRLTATINWLANAFTTTGATVFAQLGVFREPVGWFGRLALVINHPLIIGRSAVSLLWK